MAKKDEVHVVVIKAITNEIYDLKCFCKWHKRVRATYTQAAKLAKTHERTGR